MGKNIFSIFLYIKGIIDRINGIINKYNIQNVQVSKKDRTTFEKSKIKDFYSVLQGYTKYLALAEKYTLGEPGEWSIYI